MAKDSNTTPGTQDGNTELPSELSTLGPEVGAGSGSVYSDFSDAAGKIGDTASAVIDAGYNLGRSLGKTGGRGGGGGATTAAQTGPNGQQTLDMLNQGYDAEAQQYNLGIDYNVGQGVNDLTRALEDAQRAYQTEWDQFTNSEDYTLAQQRNALNRALEDALRGYQTDLDRYNLSELNALNRQAGDLNRAVSDAERMYQVQRGQIAADERNALDNAALYAEARGDKGGIGHAQYAGIQNAAAANRLAVSQQQTQQATDTQRQIADLRAESEFRRADQQLQADQVREQMNLDTQRQIADLEAQGQFRRADKLFELNQARNQMAADTYRQITDLRAQGEFKRADTMLELAQSQLAELRQIQQYADQYNLSAEELDKALENWRNNYAQLTQLYNNSMDAANANLTGAYMGSSIMQGSQSSGKALADLALGLMQSGVPASQLSPAQRTALAETYGITYST